MQPGIKTNQANLVKVGWLWKVSQAVWANDKLRIIFSESGLEIATDTVAFAT